MPTAVAFIGPTCGRDGELQPAAGVVPPSLMPSRVAGASPQLRDIQPMELTPLAYLPANEANYATELKYDGYRCLIELSPAAAPRLRTRNGANCTTWFPEVARALGQSWSGRHILDGEICVIAPDGRPDFDQLHARAQRRRWYAGAPAVTFVAFDLLVLDDVDVMQQDLVTRKEALRRLLDPLPPATLFADYFLGEGMATFLFDKVLELSLEGIVAKRLGSVYQPGIRSRDWYKVKRKGATPAGRWRRN